MAVVIATANGTSVDHEGRSLAGHCETTGVDSLTLSQLDLRAVHGCGGYLTLGGHDADLHLIVLTQIRA